ncbi:MAG: hypothetical protein K2O23_04845, partial [Anaeroplasmataceae bacterium]|nr:hypothetical protein [Anaeroplasmataceae bacterium]
EYLEMKSFFLDFLAIKNKKQAVLFYINQASKFSVENMRLFFKWLIAFYEDIFKIEDKEGLILTSLYDKILLVAKMENSIVYGQFQLILDLYSKLNYNVSAKNIFHELISKLF